MRRLCAGNLAPLLGLYAPDAVLLATYEAQPLIGHDQIAAYLNDFIGQKPGLCGSIDCLINQSLNPGVLCQSISGIYSFRWRGGSATARYTFVFTGAGIMTHHSSETP